MFPMTEAERWLATFVSWMFELPPAIETIILPSHPYEYFLKQKLLLKTEAPIIFISSSIFSGNSFQGL